MQQSSPNRARLMTIRQAAYYVGLSIATLRRMDKAGVLIPFRTPGGHRRYSRQMLDDYLQGSRDRGAKEREL